MKSVLIIGIGKLGYHLAVNMQELGNDVVIVDSDEKKVNELVGRFTDVSIGDCTNEDVLESIGVFQFDICFVTIGENFQSSLEITSLLKEHGAKYVISKASSEIQEKFLLRNGADEVIYPELHVAQNLAKRCSLNHVFECIDINSEYAIYEIPVPSEWVGSTIGDIDVRSNHNINILAVKSGEKLKPLPGAMYCFSEDEHMIVLATSKDVSKLMDN